ncbi:MAG: hypothetical protein HKO65_05735 [Gemmatimonadetes bacterium]|nr:hypothetical protein [Gemmatimonadota bacterium]NNM04586.1 hypothetical protein [Gemmatimonadota bacterium]
MLEPTLVTWVLVVFGFTTCLPLFLAQLVILKDPQGQKAKEWLVGEGEEWRDRTHFRSAYGLAWADWIVFVPLLVVGSLGVILGEPWGYLLWAAAGAISLYINVALWFMEREYVYPSRGPARYFTYYWGFFVYWGLLAVGYSLVRLVGS